MDEERNKPWYTQLPAKLAAAVVFLVALTTLVGNVIELVDKRSRPGTTTAAGTDRAPAQARKPATPSEPQPTRLRLQVDRIIVHGDGSPGTTDWRFAVEVDDRPLLVFAQEALSDEHGRNVVAPDDADGVFQRPNQGPIMLKVSGWRGSRLRLSEGEPDVVGEVSVQPGGVMAPMVVQGDRDDGGSFEFHVSISAD